MLSGGYDLNGDGRISVAELAAYWIEKPELAKQVVTYESLAVIASPSEADKAEALNFVQTTAKAYIQGMHLPTHQSRSESADAPWAFNQFTDRGKSSFASEASLNA